MRQTATMFDKLAEINERPKPFEHYNASELWTGEHTSKKMLEYHLNGSIDVSSRNTAFIDASVEWMTGRFNLGERSETIDFGCGPGLYTIRLARKGIRATGIDFSGRSIEYAQSAARKERLQIAYIHADYLRFEPEGAYDLATMIMCDYCALGPEQRKSMLSKFKRIVKPGGFILLDVYSRRYYDARTECATYEFNQLSNFWSAGDYYAFQNTFKYDDDGVILDKYTIIEPQQTRAVYNWLQCFSVDSLKAEFEENGLAVAEVLSDVAGSAYREDSPEIAVVARLP